MKVSIEEKKAEAIERMELMGIFRGVIDNFKDGKICESDSPFAACYWVNEEQKKRIEEFEKEYDALVYHVVHSYTEFGELESYLYVCDHKEEWGIDKGDIKYHYVLAYVYNKTEPEFSEIGTIMFEIGPAGGLLRIE